MILKLYYSTHIKLFYLLYIININIYMGTQPSFIKNEKLITPSSFKFHFVIGRGGFGKVWKATYIKYKRTYAIKQMNKNKIHQKKCEASVKDELDILKRINHPFIANA